MQYPFVTDQQGRLLVNFVGRFENLAEDFAAVCQRLGIHASLPYTNPSNHRDYRQFYTPAWRDLGVEHAHQDCELFGYLPVSGTGRPFHWE